MMTLTIKDISRDEDLDRKAMAKVWGGKVSVCEYTYAPGMTLGDAINTFVAYGNCLHNALS